MNGHTFSIIFGMVMFLLGLVQTLMGILLKSHKSSDDERATRHDKEIDSLRHRLHEVTTMVAELKAADYYRERDRK